MGKCSILVYKGGELSGTPTSDRAVVVVPRNLVHVDKISVPNIALENGQEAAVYQAERLFGKEGLSAVFLPVSRQDETTTALLLAVEREFLSRIEEHCLRLKVPAIGVTLGSLVLVDSGVEGKKYVAINWGDHLELASLKQGKITDLFLIPEGGMPPPVNWEDVFEVSPEELPKELPKCPQILFPLSVPVKGKRDWKKLLLLLLITFLLCLSAANYSKYMREKNRLEHLARKEASLRKKLKEIDSLKSKIDELKKKIGSLKSLTTGISPIDFLSKLAKAVPDGTVLTRATMEKGKLSVEGYTPSFSKLVESLGKAPWVKSMKITRSSRKMNRGHYKGLESFSLRLETK